MLCVSVFEASTLSSWLAPRWSVNDGRQNNGLLIYNLHRVIFGCDLFVNKRALLCESEFCTRAAGIAFFQQSCRILRCLPKGLVRCIVKYFYQGWRLVCASFLPVKRDLFCLTCSGPFLQERFAKNNKNKKPKMANHKLKYGCVPLY